MELSKITIIVGIFLLLQISFFEEFQNVDYNENIDNNSIVRFLQQARLPFIENEGQIPSDSVKYYAKTFAGTIYVTDFDLTYYSIKQEDDHSKALVIKEKFHGVPLEPIGYDKNEAVVNYFKGSQESWKTNIPTFDSVSLGKVWPNIDVSLKAYGNNVEKIFTIHPWGKISDIKVSFDGIKEISISDDKLVVNTELGQLFLSKPVAYQQINGKRHDVSSSYNIIDSKTYGFSVLSYDPKYDLVIDPLIASTFIGGSGEDIARGIVLDSSGNVYIAGETEDSTTDFPTTSGAYDETHNGGGSFPFDAFVSKFNSGLTTLSASTLIGGDDDDVAHAIAIDTSDNVYITGTTFEGTSIDFPTTSGAYSEIHNGSYDAFVSKFNSGLTTLSASTLIGGSGSDFAAGMALDSSGNVYIAGQTADDTTDFPTTSGAYDETHNGSDDVFVSKFNSGLTTLSASTLIGGSGADHGHDVTLDGSANAYVTGHVGSGFPTTSGAYDETHNGGTDDAFVSKFNSGLTSLSASTFIGGSGIDQGNAITLNDANNVYITGNTADSSTDLPTTEGAYDETHNGADDAFVSRFNSDLATLASSTFIGGSGNDVGLAITNGTIYIAGKTFSSGFPTTSDAYDTSHNSDADALVAKFDDTLCNDTTCGVPVSEGESESIDVGTAGTGEFQYTEAGQDVELDVTLPAGVSGTVTVATAVEDDLEEGTNLATAADISGPCSATCTISFTVPNSVLTDQGIEPTEASIYHDSDSDEKIEQGEAITTTRDTTSVPGSTIFTGEASFVSKFAVGGVVGATTAQAVAGLAATGQLLGLINSCDPDGFASGQSLRVYEISYDKHESKEIQVYADSTCGPISVKIVTPFGQALAGLSSKQPFLEEEVKRIVYSHRITDDVEWITVIVKDKRDDFSEKIYTNVWTGKKEFHYTTGYTAEQQGSFTSQTPKTEGTEFLEKEETDTVENQVQTEIPSWIKSNAAGWSENKIGDNDFAKGIEYLIKKDIMKIPKTLKSDSEVTKEIPSWVKSNAQWWAQGQITDQDFVKGIQYLVEHGIIKV